MVRRPSYDSAKAAKGGRTGWLVPWILVTRLERANDSCRHRQQGRICRATADGIAAKVRWYSRLSKAALIPLGVNGKSSQFTDSNFRNFI